MVETLNYWTIDLSLRRSISVVVSRASDCGEKYVDLVLVGLKLLDYSCVHI
jgi:hypothetical protein